MPHHPPFAYAGCRGHPLPKPSRTRSLKGNTGMVSFFHYFAFSTSSRRFISRTMAKKTAAALAGMIKGGKTAPKVKARVRLSSMTPQKHVRASECTVSEGR
jgi:hypothetical protein